MKYFQKSNVKVAAPRSSKKNLKFGNLTSTGFYQLQPLMYRHMTAFEHIKGQGVFFSRCNPLVVPAMTQSDYHVCNFFVRYKDVWPAWDDFNAATLHVYPAQGNTVTNAIPTKVPFMNQSELTRILIDPVFATPSTNPVDFEAHDWSSTPPVSTGYKWTSLGARAYKLLLSLGITPSFTMNYSSPSTEYFNILQLLCYGKVYCDWYYPSQYAFVNPDFSNIYAAFTTDQVMVEANHSSGYNQVYYNAVVAILTYCTQTFFDEDILYSAWDNPVSPTAGAYSQSYSLKDVTNNSSHPMKVVSGAGGAGSPTNTTFKPSDGTPFIGGDAISSQYTPVGVVTDYVLKSLQKLSNFLKRYQLAGSRAVDRFLTKYGYPLADSHRAIKLNHVVVPLNIGDVESNSDSSNGSATSVVGDLAGKGVGVGKVSFDYSSESHEGVFIMMLSVVGGAGLVQGMDKHNLHLEQLDFYEPTFDQLGVDVVQKQEFVTFSAGSYNNDPDGAFGFLPRYYEYARDQQLLTGAFRVPSLGAAELAPYYTFRMIPNMVQANAVHSLSMMRATVGDALLFNRIFYNQGLDDQFLVNFSVRFVSYGPKRQLQDSFEFDGEENNKTVSVDTSGSRVN